jgi:hypothetical protein
MSKEKENDLMLQIHKDIMFSIFRHEFEDYKVFNIISSSFALSIAAFLMTLQITSKKQIDNFLITLRHAIDDVIKNKDKFNIKEVHVNNEVKH